ncbi:MAG TPA: GyrI-like domain-containing protein [Spirochaetota bacterium]|nr:GyrI-like domain-containing protein [Spirochaetota bacterium]HOM38329.1 GyrI-like domain-containing protein [Spirochaetota bacterium]HPQ48453.1 GyrI-like domain-containing protein [Spirochaetota bacterium]
MDNIKVEKVSFKDDLCFILKDYKGPYWEADATILEVYMWGKNNIDLLAGPMWAFFYDNPLETPAEECRARFGFPLKKEIPAPDGFISMKIKNGDALTVIYKGPYYDKIKYKYYDAVYKEAKRLKSESLIEGFSEFLVEVYLNSPENTKPEDLMTQIILFVK